MTVQFSPGDLVRARGREWVTLPHDDPAALRLRPLSGTEADALTILPALERVPVEAAHFPPPCVDVRGTQENARLLAEALRLSLRRGAGPFRSSARVSFEPRAYQLVPLLMAMRLPVVRLLIADDVGIGKTVEAGLILRELLDRGEIERFCVLCPPHLVDQWVGELRTKFDIEAVAVTSASAPRLERKVVGTQSLFEVHPFTVVSLDYIKAEKRRESFAASCPPCVVVDEAHACVGTHGSRQRRYRLLQRLARDADRHMLFLTATPHSGDEEAFDRLLKLLDESFEMAGLETNAGRIALARHFVQRRRKDILDQKWEGDQIFPKHEKLHRPYSLGPDHTAFHDAVLDYCLDRIEDAGDGTHRQRLTLWSTLALLRCVGSSPAAALNALRNRQDGDSERLSMQVLDEEDEDTEAVDAEPSAYLGTDPALAKLIRQAEALVRQPDPKLAMMIEELKPLIAAGANPVVFCRYIATADYVATALRKAFAGLAVETVTGLLVPDDRRDRVEGMAEEPQRLLVATDCLSEGINLQMLFDAVVHYDLSWNPTRHQQREGRVDRFGQPAPVVKSMLLFGADSLIDSAVLSVILRKAEQIKKDLGVIIALPEDRQVISGALLNAMLEHRGRPRAQRQLDLFAKEASVLSACWRDAEEGEKRSRARYAQHALKPAEVMPEWENWRAIIGGPERVERFVARAMDHFNTALEPARETTFRADLAKLPTPIAERLDASGVRGEVRISFEAKAPAGAATVGRAHPITSTLAESLLETALDPKSETGFELVRTGAWSTNAVDAMTTIVLIRLRHKLTVHGRTERMLLAEEAVTLAFAGSHPTAIAAGEAAQEMLEAPASGDLAETARHRLIAKACERVLSAYMPAIEAYATQRGEALEADHRRVRAAAQGTPRVTVEPILPADIVGVYILTPGDL
ncbi:ATP-dependent helicase HepA [Methylobacterium gregans]|uniref:RNA polymerase-associated protein RapA n=1 Tax=Methylobacterium gregans TaxID=374424 RepID=A0AA37HTV6_9HYPH|nr:DEAD/DEAH box helicase [Methylobacterium gregans]MDQ0518830.1 ERCC4-related helicase [Methylobacterium gregans]GJD81760.1 RNA polymerase-associated protein RapA [Methylobacterium gregans]GLS57233.1 ATP-dependent helicase HepA [Methylobacterium gregans]